MTAQWRALSAEEITHLEQQGCTCENWDDVQVTEDFRTCHVATTRFSGRVKLGAFSRDVPFFGGVTKPAGIRDAVIHNCVIGNNVYIAQIHNYIANCVIEDDAVIENVDLLAVEGESIFGNGLNVAVINEAGGREVPIYDTLSAHTAYVIALYRHRPIVIEKLTRMIRAYADSVKSPMGLVGKGARIVNSRIIRNVRIGPAAVIEGVHRLEEGSVNSCAEDPAYIGSGVCARNFIASSGARITDGTVLTRCFVGQATELGKGYCAENSVFFANCGALQGEACSIFAGPHTVTHHKSTLLIAGLFSFFNAGSGTNQSNHMYRLGPVHQGIVERGSKTGSGSYMLWPAGVGAFTVVVGRHHHNVDTRNLPFSYLIEKGEESILVPGINLRNAGTARDAFKWPQRDNRKDTRKLDHINFELLSPYTIQKMISGRSLLLALRETPGSASDHYACGNVKIPAASLERGIDLYQKGIDKYLGDCLLKRLDGRTFRDIRQLRAALRPDTNIGTGPWVDLAGLLAPQEAIEGILNNIETGRIASLDDLNAEFAAVHAAYTRYEWTWAVQTIQTVIGKAIDLMTADDIVGLIRRWKNAVSDLDLQLRADAAKEFTPTAQIGFGLDGGDPETVQADFDAVRGSLESNSFVRQIEKHTATRTALADDLIRRIEPLRG
jgi:NDP-sugar pyrophosphorylase family protein